MADETQTEGQERKRGLDWNLMSGWVMWFVLGVAGVAGGLFLMWSPSETERWWSMGAGTRIWVGLLLMLFGLVRRSQLRRGV